MNDFTITFMVAILTGVVAWAVSVIRPEAALLYMIMGFVACSGLCWRSARLILRYSNHRLGLLGEQVVGQILDRLSSDSVQVFHDLEIKEPGKKPWNIDHVVITPAGVFVIETKTRRKPRGAAPDGQQGHKVIFDGQQLRFPSPMSADRHGLDQTQRNADWLASKLTALNGTAVPVTPVLVLPGWLVERTGKGPVSVLNPIGLTNFLAGRSSNLTAIRQRAIAAQLEECCRIDLSRPV